MVVLNLHCWVLTSFWLALKHSWLEFAWACLGGAQILMKFEILEIIGQKGICLISFRLMAPRFRGTGMTSRSKCYLFLSRTVLHRSVWQISKTVVCLSVSLFLSLPSSFFLYFFLTPFLSFPPKPDKAFWFDSDLSRVQFVRQRLATLLPPLSLKCFKLPSPSWLPWILWGRRASTAQEGTVPTESTVVKLSLTLTRRMYWMLAQGLEMRLWLCG